MQDHHDVEQPGSSQAPGAHLAEDFMSKQHDSHSPRSRARRHFLGVMGAAGARAAIVGSLLAAAGPARAMGNRWWLPGRGGGGGGGEDGANCLLRGTRIGTPSGPVAVEELSIGDLVHMADGTVSPVRWIGRQSFRKGGTSWGEGIMPVRIARGALGAGLPHRDLYLSPDHALFIDGVLIRARDLDNGRTIRAMAEPLSGTLDYFNILLDRHAVVLAEGAPVESFQLRGDNYRNFNNFAEFERLFDTAKQSSMQPFVPVRGYEGGRENLHALLCLVLPMRDVVAETRERLSALDTVD